VRVPNGIEDPATGLNTSGRALMKSYKYSTFTVKGGVTERVAVLDRR
jgi:hypothetical protein